MPHIILDGHFRADEGLAQLLRQWAMTFAVRQLDREQTLPTIDECDAVILGPQSRSMTAEKPASAHRAAAAPIVLLGENPGSVLLSRDTWRAVPDPGPEGIDLRSALFGCCEEAARLREGDQATQNKDGYLHFLGHELRSPLTAAKTALEVLQGELGGWSDQDDALAETTTPHDPRLKMLDIALRNIKRLHRTVDWSQDLHELEAGASPHCWEEVPVTFLAEVLGERLPIVVEQEASGKIFATDPGMLKILLGQLTRVLEYAMPEGDVRGRVRLNSGRSRELVLELFAQGLSAESGPRVTRTHLTRIGTEGECTVGEELELLVQYVVSRRLTDRLQARVAVVDEPGSPTTLLLHLVNRHGAAEAEDPLAALHAPA